MEINSSMTAEDVFVQVAETVCASQMTPTAAMKLTADALSLMAVAWRPDDVDADGSARVRARPRGGVAGPDVKHPFAGGQGAN